MDDSCILSFTLGRTFVKNHRNTAQTIRREFLKAQIWSLGNTFNVKFLHVSNPNLKTDMIPSLLSISLTTNTVFQVPTENDEFVHKEHQGFAGQALSNWFQCLFDTTRTHCKVSQTQSN